MKFFYWKNSRQGEIDFAVKNEKKVKGIIRVCWDPET